MGEKSGDRAGRYLLLEEIGSGGCGAVFLAEQQEPVRRRVAVKVIKLGMDTRSVVARFEAERQALAMMDHPNIARVLHAGATDSTKKRTRSAPGTRASPASRLYVRYAGSRQRIKREQFWGGCGSVAAVHSPAWRKGFARHRMAVCLAGSAQR